LHWSPTRAVRGTDCAPESGAALSGDEAHWPATGVGLYIRIQGPEKSSGNYVRNPVRAAESPCTRAWHPAHNVIKFPSESAPNGSGALCGTRKLKANRENARKSTGPKTPKVKAHGLFVMMSSPDVESVTKTSFLQNEANSPLLSV